MAPPLDFSVLPLMGDIVLGDYGDYAVLRVLGKGAFGAVYEVERKDDCVRLAMKCESLACKKPMYKMECKVLANAHRFKSPHFLKVYDKGVGKKGYHFLVMQIVGKNLWDLRAATKEKVFSLGTTLRVAEQTLAGIRDMHQMGFLHRDIKPPNFSCGRREDDQLNTIFILDFGLSRKFRDSKGWLLRERASAAFRGTTRYASLAALRGQEQSRKDDVEAWFYMMFECLVGIVPWRKFAGTEREKILKMKVDFRKREVFEEAIMGQKPSRELRRIMRYIDEMVYESVPDYRGIYNILRKIAKNNDISDKEPLDWTPDMEYDGPPFVSAERKKEPAKSAPVKDEKTQEKSVHANTK